MAICHVGRCLTRRTMNKYGTPPHPPRRGRSRPGRKWQRSRRSSWTCEAPPESRSRSHARRWAARPPMFQRASNLRPRRASSTTDRASSSPAAPSEHAPDGGFGGGDCVALRTPMIFVHGNSVDASFIARPASDGGPSVYPGPQSSRLQRRRAVRHHVPLAERAGRPAAELPHRRQGRPDPRLHHGVKSAAGAPWLALRVNLPRRAAPGTGAAQV